MEKIKFHYLADSFTFRNRKEVKRFLMGKFQKAGRKVEAINYIFCDDAYLLAMNKQYLAHDTLTDIITFELSGKNEALVSDIFISVERVRENAIGYNVSFNVELHRVIFHGALHLLGFKDKKKEDVRAMRTEEEKWLGDYFPRGTFSSPKD